MNDGEAMGEPWGTRTHERERLEAEILSTRITPFLEKPWSRVIGVHGPGCRTKAERVFGCAGSVAFLWRWASGLDLVSAGSDYHDVNV